MGYLIDDGVVGWRHRLNGHEFEQSPELVIDRVWCGTVPGVAKSQTWLNDLTDLNWEDISLKMEEYSKSALKSLSSVGYILGKSNFSEFKKIEVLLNNIFYHNDMRLDQLWRKKI